MSKQMSRIVWCVGALAAVVLAGHVVSQLLLRLTATSNLTFIELAARFNVDNELSVPTWFSSVLAFASVACAYALGSLESNALRRGGWWLLGIVFALISVDEVSSFHELLLQTVHGVAHFGDRQTFEANAWLIVIPIVAVLFGAVARLWYRQLPRRVFFWILGSFAVYFFGAIVIEYLSIEVARDSVAYIFGYSFLEEGFEIAGLYMMFCVMAGYLDTHYRIRARSTEK